MEGNTMFEKASRMKLRFDTPKGMLSVEDLWDLPLTSKIGRANLDDIARALHHKLKNDDDVSFVDKAKKSDATVQLGFDVVKYIIDVRIAENDAANKAAERREKAQQIMALISQKENEALGAKSVEELRQMLEQM